MPDAFRTPLSTTWRDDAQPPLNQLWAEIEERFGLCPSFFKLAQHAPPIAWHLFRMAEFTYLDNPMPAHFKERLFTWLSRFCEVRYCVSRHCAFLLGRGHVAGDASAPPLNAAQALALLQQLMPAKEELPEYLSALEETRAPLEDWPEFDSDLGRRFRVACGVVFLDPRQAAPWLHVLRELLGARRYEQLMLFLAFVRMAHFWTQVHPELAFEPDLETLLREHEALAEPLLHGAGESGRWEMGQQLYNELQSLRESQRMVKELQASERRLKLIINSLPAHIAYVDSNQRYRFANRGYRKQFRRRSGGLRGRTVREVIGEENYRIVQPQVEAALRGERQRYEFDLCTIEGESRRLEATYVPHRLDDGSVVGCFILVVDITGRMQAVEDTRLLSEISRGIQLAASAEALWEAVVRAVGEHLQVARCFFVEVDEANDRGIVRCDYRRGAPPGAGEYRLSDYGDIRDDVRVGRTVINGDAKSNPRTAALYEKVYSPAGERAYIAVPLRREDRWAGVLVVSAPEPRKWQPHEIALLEAVAERAWYALEKLRMDSELRKKEERFKATFENAAVGIAHVSPDGRWLEVNQRLCDIVGYSREELMTQTFGDITHPDDLEADWKQARLLLAGKIENYSTDKRYYRKDGSIVWINLTRSLMRKADGSPDYFISFVEDIDARKRAEGKLREREERLLLASRAAGLGIFEWDVAADRAVWENERMYEIFGHTRADGTLSKVQLIERYVHPDDAAALEQTLAGGMKSGRPFHIVYRIRRKDGALRWLELAGEFESAHSGAPIRMIGVLADITERQQAEEKLRESEERFRLLADTAPVLIWTSGVDKLCNFFNKAWLAFTGRTMEQELGNGWTEGVHTEDYDRCVETYVRSFEAREAFKMEYRLRRYDGEYRWLLDHGIPRFSSSGQFLGYIGSCIDITERKQAEAERAQLAQEQAARAAAEAATRSKDEFLAIVSHELRSPLSAILGYTRMLRSDSVDRNVINKVTAVVERNGKAQLQIIEDLLDSARVVTGKLRIEPAPVDLVPVLESALDTVRAAAEAKGVILLADFAPLPEETIGDSTRLQQIVWNLLANAVKFTPKGGRIELRMESDADNVRISVSDTGKGIEAEFLPFVFDRYRQADTSSARRYGGLGLGLSLVKNLVELHGGTITAASDGKGRGATFTVVLPRGRRESFPTETPAVSPRESRREGAVPMDQTVSLKGVNVLVVDDQEEARVVLTQALSEYGAQVTTLSSGAEAMTLLSDPPAGMRPDVLILDIAMPDEDGYTVLKRVLALNAEPPIPAIALTAYGRSEDRLRALQAGFDMYVAKPVEPTELAVVIDSLMTRRAWGRRRKIS
jgi:PAS domain S-box-containing protein